METTQITLPSGVRVSLKRDPQARVVSLGWLVPAGHGSESAKQSPLASHL